MKVGTGRPMPSERLTDRPSAMRHDLDMKSVDREESMGIDGTAGLGGYSDEGCGSSAVFLRPRWA